VDETEYRQTYRQVNKRKCVFEKAINARRCTCSQAQRFNLADREGVACNSDVANETCATLLTMMRQNASFALQMTNVPGPLPHAKEVKVQIGGMQGIQSMLYPDKQNLENVEDIYALTNEAIKKFDRLELLSYTEIVKSIVKFQGRQRTSRKK
jgi:hypothetical protein